jgi:acetoacetyl-CoA synthetase
MGGHLTPAAEGKAVKAQLYQPDPSAAASSALCAFIDHCERETGREFLDYTAFESFAKLQFRAFWRLFLDWSQIICEGERDPVCVGDDCETAVFFSRAAAQLC